MPPRTGVALSSYTRFGLGGPADCFLETPEEAEFVAALRETPPPVLVLGGGTNLIVSDSGFRGAVLRYTGHAIWSQGGEVHAQAGAVLQDLVDHALDHALQGLETLAGIPGWVGAAVYGNAGAYGRNISELVDSLVVLDTDGKIKHIQKKQLEFNYRSSIFKEKVKNKKDKYFRPAILTVKLKVARNNKDAILRLINNFLKMRKNKYPKGYSVGSVFKNVEVAKHPAIDDALKSYIFDEKLPAGVLLENIGAKKMRQGAIYVPQEHANFIINKGSGTAFDFQQLIENLKQKVYEEYGIVLEEEIEYVGQITKSKTSIWEKIKKKF